jgi:hypothetical protein
VNVDAMQCGATSFTRVASARSAAQGAWSSAVKPAMNTSYRASWKNATSVPLAAKVGPAVSLKRVRAGRFTASVTAAQSFVGKYVVLQRYRRAWKNVKRVTLRTVKAGTAPTQISSSGFRARRTRGARLRLLLTRPQAGACYAAARSAAIRG